MSLSDITSRITAAKAEANRPAGSTRLIAVSKVQPDERVRSVLETGHRVFGENKVQEAQGKWPSFREEFGPVEVHLIGPLQSNKVKPAVELFDAIHTLDRAKLARKIASEIQAQGKSPELFIQVNTGEEPQKAGVLPAEADSFIAECRAMDLVINGLMVIPPVDEEPALHFSLLRKIAERNGLSGLSMGMSSDFERAVALGATHVRVGSAIFGERAYEV
ncbi:YggS family pyridoxal phosphate-dependent enzyme [Neptunicoccus cionae]|uniref:Pyridoxal phosphate homeostasis protein n=1 Tax=Neptunicoccus cionae TaxID=2035344 RepID=A0A916QWZ5_9RHOB|nr:YggS family pyridoxal phosphate-dependent enzyme [Amylibacter cionae]GGA19651.1 YggS family pyridoxal phosphate enzyme [Amylibacter cionae]